MDIVKRLRGHAKGNAGGVRELLMLSADEIERLRQLNERFGKALQKIAVSGSDEGAWIIAYKAIMETMWGE